jgi:hypothetical protein
MHLCTPHLFINPGSFFPVAERLSLVRVLLALVPMQSYEEEAGAAFPLEGMLGSSPKSLGHTKSRWLQQRERLAREYGEYAVRMYFGKCVPMRSVLVMHIPATCQERV